MKRLVFSFSIIIFAFTWIFHTAASDNHSVNSIIGDISYIKKFGHLPAAGTDESLRIKTHLEYAEMLLRKNSSLSPGAETQAKRNKLIAHLRDYRLKAIFPTNKERKNERSPCFIDQDGNICAVGYLVEQSAGRQLAESINRDFQYSKIADMDSPALSAWLKENGLTREDAAIIQPSYDWDPTPREEKKTNYISKSYGISSSVISGLNLTFNGLQVLKGNVTPLSSKLGLLGGAAQTTLGILSLPAKTTNHDGQVNINEHKKVLSLVNIGIGSGTMLLSSWKLFSKKSRKESMYSWDVHGIPLSENETAVAILLKRKF